MKKLRTELKYQGRILRQLKREGKIALYELRGGQGLLYGYEVIVVRILPEGEIMGRHYEQREAFPEKESWGQEGWSFGRNQQKEALESFAYLATAQDCLETKTDLTSPEELDSGGPE